MGLIIFFIMVVAAFNIVGTLTMVVTDKTREIGILQAMGLTSPAIARVFLVQGAVIGLVGTALGLVLGPDRGVRGGHVRLDADQPRRLFHRSPAGARRAAGRRSSWCSRASRSPCSPRSIPPAPPRGSRRSKRSGTNERDPRGGRASARSIAGGDGSPIEVLAGVDLGGEPGRVRGDHRRERLGKEHAAASPGRAGHARPAARCGSTGRRTASWTRRAGRGAEPKDRIRVPVPSPAAGVHRAGERDDAAAHRGGGRSRGPLTGGGAAGGGGARGPDDPSARRRCPAASSSGPRWPARWRPTRWSCWPTSPPATWITATASGCTELFARLSREFETALVVVTHNRLLAARADRVLSLENGRLVPLPGVESMP